MMTPAAARAVILVTELLTFLLGTAALAYFMSFAGAIEPAPGEPPPDRFPVLVHEAAAGAPPGAKAYEVMPWSEWTRRAASRPGASLLLPERSGSIPLGNGTHATFRSEPQDASRQVVELRWRTADGEQVSRYIARAREIEPQYFRTLDGNTLLTSAIAAFLLSFFLGRALRTRWLSRGYFS